MTDPAPENNAFCISSAPPRKEHPRIAIVLDRLRSAHNTGNIFRIAEASGVSEILCCGYTPAPPHPKLAKTAMGTEKMVPFRTFKNSLDAVRTLRSEGFSQILAVEPGEASRDAWEIDYQFPLALIFGNEALGVAPETIAETDGLAGLPMLGKKASINVGNCAAAVLYAVLAQIRKKAGSAEKD